jgi:hypothetical protein
MPADVLVNAPDPLVITDEMRSQRARRRAAGCSSSTRTSNPLRPSRTTA